MKQAMYHQPEVLKRALKREGIGKVSDDSSDVIVVPERVPVHVIDNDLYYCRMRREAIQLGESVVVGETGTFFPEEVVLVGAEGWNVPDGHYTLRRPQITLNGKIEVAFTEETDMIPVTAG